MISIDAAAIRELLEALIAGLSVLGGGMAYFSGSNAAKALAEGQPPAVLTQQVNEGIGQGFNTSKWLSILALAVMVST